MPQTGDPEATGVIFDLDGTLIDSAPDIHAAGNAVLADEGLPGVTLAQATAMIGAGTPTFVARLADAAGVGNDTERRDRMYRNFMDRYLGAHELTRLYPGVAAALSALREAGHRLAICTNKPEAPARTVVEALGLSEHVDALIGGDSLSVKKPDPAPLHAAARAIGVQRAIFVGDSEIDAETAQAAGVPFALFTRGYRKTPVDRIAHDVAFDDHGDLAGLLARIG
ncbi:phosphoglycolate phosphatase [Tranquillimonas rosea]|uniref:phosphoglycolate phosphatase n=1 Tax=Tranquillimonas rosea TaxID=641238 RepID=UPI003BADB6F8